MSKDAQIPESREKKVRKKNALPQSIKNISSFLSHVRRPCPSPLRLLYYYRGTIEDDDDDK
jgi:hypothetical protein